MKFSERFLEIPVRIYDPVESEKTARQMEDLNLPYNGTWKTGRLSFKPHEIETYSEYLDSADSDEFCGIIISTAKGDYISTLTKEEFEVLVDEWVEKYEAYLDGLEEELFKKAL